MSRDIPSSGCECLIRLDTRTLHLVSRCVIVEIHDNQNELVLRGCHGNNAIVSAMNVITEVFSGCKAWFVVRHKQAMRT